MTCYVLGQIEVTEPSLWPEYLAAGAASLEEYGVESVFVCDAPEVVEGAWFGPRTVLLKFPDRAAAMKWYGSSAFQSASEIRKRAANCNVVLIDTAELHDGR